MKATELRIGNLIGCDISTLVVKSINLETVVCHSLSSKPYVLLIEDVYGLKLTEEWLLKFGFKLVIDEYCYTLHDTCELSQNDYGNTFYFMGNYIKSNIKYVHQLQNLYFALTGEELEIK